ncbi:MAG: DUF4845 domain-containing protein [Rubrivivax sp.]|nr:MAG: DUF4845 domain-containing protein [Rubrivivax sp.]
MNRNRRSLSSPSHERGLSLIGLLFWGAMVALVAVIGMKVFPTVLEYYTVQRVVDRVAAGNPSTVPQVRQEFERARQIEYSIQSITGSDLVISKDANDRVVIEFSWDKEVDLFGPVYLMIKYRGKSH